MNANLIPINGAASDAERTLVDALQSLPESGFKRRLGLAYKMVESDDHRLLAAVDEAIQSSDPDRIEELLGVPWPEPDDRGDATLSELGGVEYVEDLIRPGRIVVVAAEEGTGKSYAITGELAIRVSVAGGRFAGTWPIVRQGPVLVLSEMHSDDDFAREDVILDSLELTRASLRSRYYRLPLASAARDKPALQVPEWRRWITGWLREHGALMAVFDTATAAAQVDPWGGDIQAVYRGLRVMLADYPELAIVLIVHLKKPQGRGERRISDVLGEWGRWCDVLLLLERDGDARLKVSSRKRVRHERRIVAVKRDGLLVDPHDLGEGVAPKVSPEQVLAAISDEPGITLTALSERIGVSPGTASGYVKKLEAAGQVTRIKGGNGRKDQLFSPNPPRTLLDEAPFGPSGAFGEHPERSPNGGEEDGDALGVRAFGPPYKGTNPEPNASPAPPWLPVEEPEEELLAQLRLEVGQ